MGPHPASSPPENPVTAILPQATSLTVRLSPKGRLLLPHLTDEESEAWRVEATTQGDTTCEQQGQDSGRERSGCLQPCPLVVN